MPVRSDSIQLRSKGRCVMTHPENLLSLNLKRLSLKDLATVFEGLTLLNRTLSGLSSQPKCWTAGDLNAAGDMLTNLSERIAAEMSEIVAIAKERQPVNVDDRALRFFLLMSDEIWAHADPDSLIVEAQVIVAKMPTINQIERVGGYHLLSWYYCRHSIDDK